MGTWNNDNGPAQASKFFYVGGRVYAFGQPGGSHLNERTGIGVWVARSGGLINQPQDVTYWNSTWWAACADGVYSTTNPIAGWTLRWPCPANHTARTVAGYSGSAYLTISVMELVGFIEPTIHFLRYSTAGGWEFDFIASYTNPNAWPNALVSADLIYYGSDLWWSVDEQGTGYVFRYYDGAWNDYTDNLEIGRFLHVTGDGMYFISCSLDEVWRNSGVGWRLDYDCADDISFIIGLSEGDDSSLWFGAGDGAGNIRAHAKQGGVWGIATSTVADPWVGGAIQAGGDIFMGGNWNVYFYAPSFDVTPVGGGLYPGALDCDGDGNALYIALYNPAGQPILVKAPLPLSAATTGAAVFNPGAGLAINVRCTNVGGRLAIAGRLSAGGNDSVQVSDDGGLTWADIAPNWVDTAQPLWVSPDTESEDMVALVGVPALEETLNRGQDWIVENPALGLVPDSMAKLPLGDEVVLGGAGPTVLYSPNRGTTTANITGVIGGAGPVVALEVV